MMLDPTIDIECDTCEHFETFELTALSGGCFDCRGVKSKAESSGWIIDGDKHYCSKNCEPLTC